MALNNLSLLDDEDEDLVPQQEEQVDPNNLDLAALPDENEEPSEENIQPEAPQEDAEGDGSAPAGGPPELGSAVQGLPRINPGLANTQTPNAKVPPNAQDIYEQTLKRAPDVYRRTPPKWYQKLGAVATGAAAGWNNANPHTRPVDSSGAIQGILYPGQARKEAQYGVELGAAKQAADAERSRKLEEARVQEYGARAGAETARGKYYQDVGDARVKQALDKGKTPLEKYTALMEIPGMTTDRAISIATTGKEQPASKAPAGMTQVTQDVGEKMGVVPNKAKEYWVPSGAIGANLKLENQPDRIPKTAEERINQIDADPDMSPQEKKAAKAQVISDYRSMHPRADEAGPKPLTRAQAAQIETRKQRELQQAEQRAALRKRGDRARGTPPEPWQKVDADLAADKDRIQSAYEAEISAATGNQVPHNPWAAGQQPAPARAPAAPTGAVFPRQHLAGFMKANGYTSEQQALQALIPEGFSGISK